MKLEEWLGLALPKSTPNLPVGPHSDLQALCYKYGIINIGGKLGRRGRASVSGAGLQTLISLQVFGIRYSDF